MAPHTSVESIIDESMIHQQVKYYLGYSSPPDVEAAAVTGSDTKRGISKLQLLLKGSEEARSSITSQLKSKLDLDNFDSIADVLVKDEWGTTNFFHELPTFGLISGEFSAVLVASGKRGLITHKAHSGPSMFDYTYACIDVVKTSDMAESTTTCSKNVRKAIENAKMKVAMILDLSRSYCPVYVTDGKLWAYKVHVTKMFRGTPFIEIEGMSTDVMVQELGAMLKKEYKSPNLQKSAIHDWSVHWVNAERPKKRTCVEYVKPIAKAAKKAETSIVSDAPTTPPASSPTSIIPCSSDGSPSTDTPQAKVVEQSVEVAMSTPIASPNMKEANTGEAEELKTQKDAKKKLAQAEKAAMKAEKDAIKAQKEEERAALKAMREAEKARKAEAKAALDAEKKLKQEQRKADQEQRKGDQASKAEAKAKKEALKAQLKALASPETAKVDSERSTDDLDEAISLNDKKRMEIAQKNQELKALAENDPEVSSPSSSDSDSSSD